MDAEIKIRNELLSPPGDTILETIEKIGMSQVELAERLGRPKEKINGIIKGKEPITIKTAILLERVLSIPVSFWLNRETEYRAELEKIEQYESLRNSIKWYAKFPIRELKKRGYDIPFVNPTPTAVEMAKMLVALKLTHSRYSYPGFDWEKAYKNRE